MDRRVLIGDFFTCCALSLLIACNMLSNVAGIATLLTIIKYLTLAFLVIAILLSVRKLTIKSLIFLLLIIVFAGLTAYVSENTSIPYLILFMISARKTDFNKIIKTDLFTKVLFLIIVIILYLAGCTQAVTATFTAHGERYSLGFGNPNTLAVYLLGIYLDILFLIQKSKLWRKFLLAIAFYFAIVTITGSRSSSITVIISIVLSVIPLERIRKNKASTIVLSSLFWIATIVTLLLTLNLSNPIITRLNRTLSGRISLQSAFLDTYGIKPFGNNFINYRTSSGSSSVFHVLDSAYMQLLVHFGLIVFIIFGILYSRRTKRSILQEEKGTFVGLLAFIFFGLIENGLYVIQYNPYLLTLLSAKNEEKQTSVSTKEKS